MIAGALADNQVERIRHHLVGLRMPRALEALAAVIQQLERGQVSAIEAIDTLLAEEITVREGRRIMALASLDFIDKHEVVHLVGQSGTGKSHLAIARGVEAIRAGRSVYFCPLADIIDSLAKADREGRLRERIRHLCRTQPLIIDEIGYVTLGAAAATPSSPRPCSTGCCIMPSSSTSKARAAACASAPTCCRRPRPPLPSRMPKPERRAQTAGPNGGPKRRAQTAGPNGGVDRPRQPPAPRMPAEQRRSGRSRLPSVT